MKNLAIILSSSKISLMKSYVNKKIVPNFDILDQTIIQYLDEALSSGFEKYYFIYKEDEENYLKIEKKNTLIFQENEQIVKSLYMKKEILKNMDNVLFIYDNLPLITQESIQKLLINLKDFEITYNDGICMLKRDTLMSLFYNYFKYDHVKTLGDLIETLKNDGNNVKKIDLEKDDLFAVVDCLTLSNAIQIMKRRINEFHMLNGINIVDPLTTYIGKHVKIGNDTIIYPNTYIFNSSIIGINYEIGPNALIENSFIDNDVAILNCVVKHQNIKKS